MGPAATPARILKVSVRLLLSIASINQSTASLIPLLQNPSVHLWGVTFCIDNSDDADEDVALIYGVIVWTTLSTLDFPADICYIHVIHQVGPSIRSPGSNSSRSAHQLSLMYKKQCAVWENMEESSMMVHNQHICNACLNMREILFLNKVVHMMGWASRVHHLDKCMASAWMTTWKLGLRRLPTTSEPLQKHFQWNFKLMHIEKIFRSVYIPIICWNSFKQV